MWYGKNPSMSMLGPKLECPECGEAQHPEIASGTPGRIELVRCKRCGHVASPGAFGQLDEDARRERAAARKREWERRKRESDPAFRERRREISRKYRETHREEIAKRRRDPDYRAKVNARERERWANDPEYRTRRLELGKEYRERKRERMGDVAYRREHRMYERERKKRKAAELAKADGPCQNTDEESKPKLRDLFGILAGEAGETASEEPGA